MNVDNYSNCTMCEIFHKYIEVKFRKLYIEIEEVSEIFHKLLRKIKVKKQNKGDG